MSVRVGMGRSVETQSLNPQEFLLGQMTMSDRTTISVSFEIELRIGGSAGSGGRAVGLEQSRV
jgi:hypothetical protein